MTTTSDTSRIVTTSDTSRIVTTRARAFGGRMETIRAAVAADGSVRVYDDLAGYYTTCHSLSMAAIRRIRRLAQQ